MVPIKELSEIKTITGPLLIFRDNHARFCAVKFSVRGRDMGTAVAEAQKKVNAAVHLPEGYTLKWTGDFENQQRATQRLAQVVPVSIIIIFIILFILFSNARDAGLVLLNVSFAAVGGIAALLITRFNFSISAGIGFIALLVSVSKWSDYDIRYQTQSAGEVGVARCCKNQCAFQGSARADDGCNGGYRPDACGAESWNRFRIAATAGHCYYRRSDRGYFLRFVCFPVDCRDRLW